MTSALKAAADEFLVRYGGDIFPNLFTSEIKVRRPKSLPEKKLSDIRLL